jgi:hypothetical protein
MDTRDEDSTDPISWIDEYESLVRAGPFSPSSPVRPLAEAIVDSCLALSSHIQGQTLENESLGKILKENQGKDWNSNPMISIKIKRTWWFTSEWATFIIKIAHFIFSWIQASGDLEPPLIINRGASNSTSASTPGIGKKLPIIRGKVPDRSGTYHYFRRIRRKRGK